MRILDKDSAERRKTKILNALVTTYISTGAPVASSRVVARTRLGLSAATIRTVITQLDEEGLTVQPHTSAGRIPTPEGFKAFVQSLAPDDSEAREFWARAENDYDFAGDAEGSVGNLLERCCSLLSEASGEAGAVLSPSFVNDVIREIRLVEVDPGRILAVVISDVGIVTSNTIHLGKKVGYFNLRRIEEYLNAKLRGPGFADVFSETYWDESERQAGEHLYSEVVLKYIISGGSSGKRELYLEGFSKVFEKPEMRDPQTALSVVRFLEDKAALMEVLASAQKNDRLTVRIGEEIRPGERKLAEMSLVAAPYKVGGVSVGALGVIGSMRMRYPKIIPLVKHATGFLGMRLSEVVGRGKIGFGHAESYAMTLKR